MITKLHLENFQSHEDTTLRFSPGVNVIVGSSDCGKTAMLRALNWVVFNRPSGDSLCSHWGGDTLAEIVLDEKVISRGKSKKENTYAIGSTQFSGFGLSVPEPVQQLINVSDINIQYQLDAPFLLSKSPGEVAATLNEMVNLHEIDQALTRAKSEVQGTKRDLDTHKAEQKQMEEQLEKLKPVEGLLDQEQKLTELKQFLEMAQEQVQKLSLLKGGIQQAEEELKGLKWLDTAQKMLDRVSKWSEEQFSLTARYNTLTEQVSRLRDSQEQLQKFNQVPELLEQLTQVQQWKEESTRIRQQWERLFEIREKLYVVHNSLGEMNRLPSYEDQVKRSQTLLNSLDLREYDYERLFRLFADHSKTCEEIGKTDLGIINLQVELSHFPEVCPLCGSRRSDAHFHS